MLNESTHEILMSIPQLREVHKQAVYDCRSNLKSPMKRSMDHYAKCRRNCGLTKITRMIVKETYDPKPLTGMILLDGGREANELYEKMNPKPILKKKNKGR